MQLVNNLLHSVFRMEQFMLTWDMRSRVYVTVGRPSVCPSHCPTAAACCGFAAERPTVSIDRDRRLTATAPQQQMRAVSCWQAKVDAEHKVTYLRLLFDCLMQLAVNAHRVTWAPRAALSIWWALRTSPCRGPNPSVDRRVRWIPSHVFKCIVVNTAYR